MLSKGSYKPPKRESLGILLLNICWLFIFVVNLYLYLKLNLFLVHDFIYFIIMIFTFHFNIKYSLLELLCTPTRLYEGTPLQLLQLDLFRLTFPSILAQNCHLSLFSVRDNTTRGWMHISYERSPLPNRTTPTTFLHLPLIPQKGKLQACTATFCVTARHWRNVSLAFC